MIQVWKKPKYNYYDVHGKNIGTVDVFMTTLGEKKYKTIKFEPLYNRTIHEVIEYSIDIAKREQTGFSVKFNNVWLKITPSSHVSDVYRNYKESLNFLKQKNR